MKITKRQLKKIILEFLDTKSYSQTATSSKFAKEFAEGYEAAFTRNGLQPDHSGEEIFEIFKANFTGFVKNHGGSLKESKKGDPKGGLRHFLKFLAHREKRVPSDANRIKDYKKFLGDDPGYDEIADQYDKLRGIDTEEANIARRELIMKLPTDYQVAVTKPLKAADGDDSSNQSLSRQVFKSLAAGNDLKVFGDDIGLGISPFNDAVVGVFAGLIGSVPAGFATYYMINSLFPMLDPDLGAGLMVASAAFALGAIFACSTSAELFKQYKKSLQSAGDKSNTPYGGNIGLEEYSEFLDQEYDKRYEEEKAKVLASAQQSFEAQDQKVTQMIETKKQTISEYYKERAERIKGQPELIDISTGQESDSEDNSWQYGSVDYGEDYDSEDDN